MPATRALVIGGSLAGMCAGRVLSDAFDNVTIIERDTYPSAPEFRQGVPQARHVHNLLARGLREFESFFPGFEARMRDRGAVPVETGWTSPRCGRMDGLGALTPDYGNSTPAGHLSRVLYSNFVDVYRT
jgi:2-polyprenyl-6-methoxyphenol hydroxylase-like FAD-dependent oxidoreductase